jgi:hypothetical protein
MKSYAVVRLLVGTVFGGTAVPLHGASSSYYTLRPEDTKAVYLTRNGRPVSQGYRRLSITACHTQ